MPTTKAVDFTLVFSQAERESIESGSASDVFNRLLETLATLRDYDVIVLMASDWRIELIERILGREVIAIELGHSPIREDVTVDIEELVAPARRCHLRRRREAPHRSREHGAQGCCGPRREVDAIKEVVSVSIGSSKRDHEVEIELLGEQFKIRREGTDGDMDAASRRFAELDGTVDAFGVGGTDLFLRFGDHDYYLRDARKARSAASKKTPVVCGTGSQGRGRGLHCPLHER